MTMPFCATTIPQELKERPQWVVWKSEYRDDKLTKIPYNALNGLNAKANDRTTWAPYDACMQALAHGYSGVGFEFTKEDGITGIDFDECIDPNTGKVTPEVLDMVKRLSSYTEVSQSGQGLHVLVKGTLLGKQNRKGHIEMYDDRRFFVMTGQCLPKMPHTIEPRQDELNALYRSVFGDKTEVLPVVAHSKNSTHLEDELIIKKASTAKNGSTFKRLFDDGDTSEYDGDDSRADLGLCVRLRFWTGGDSAQIDRIFRRSALYRSKWDERHGSQTYGDMTIAKALTLDSETYEPVFGSDNGEAYLTPWEGPLLYHHDPAAINAIINGKAKTDKELRLPTINKVEISGEITSIEGLHDVFKGHLYIQEDYNIDGPVCAVIASYLVDEPDIIGLVGPSGSIKTELLRSFGESQNQFCYPISSVTEHTFVSGLKENVDTIPLLRGRPVIIKDLTTLLSKKEDIRSAVFADFRELTDGYLQKEFGNGVKKEYHNIHSSVIFGCTSAIERYYSMYSNLGARMVFMKPQNDPKKARAKSRTNQRNLKAIRSELKTAMLGFIESALQRLSLESLPEMPDEMAEEIGTYCDLLSWLRHPVYYNHRGFIDEVPDPEFPTRLINTISKLTQVHAFVYGHEVVGELDKAFALRICTDNVPMARAKMLKALKGHFVSTSELSEETDMSPGTTRHRLNELQALKIAEFMSSVTAGSRDDYDGRANHYRISPEWLETAEIFKAAMKIGGRLETENDT